MGYTCTECDNKINFNNYWAFCFDCRNLKCEDCHTEHDYCCQCNNKYFIDEQTDLNRIVKNIEDDNVKNKSVLHFFNSIFRLNGIGCNIDHKEAYSQMFISVMTKSFVPAIHTLGTFYGNGIGVETDFDQAHKYFLRGALQGYNESIYCIGLEFLRGFAVEKDKDEAILYIELSAKRGYINAYIHLSNLYRENLKFKEALYWQKKYNCEKNHIKKHPFLRHNKQQ